MTNQDAGIRAALERIAALYDADAADSSQLTLADFNHGEDYAYWYAAQEVNRAAVIAREALHSDSGASS